MTNIIAIVGRPNVGKSTFFNRLIGRRQAIVDAAPGVTRDRHYGKADWNGISFSVIDTGGLIAGSEDVFDEQIKKQVEIAIDESTLIIFMLDVLEGITPLDEDVAKMLRKIKKPVFLVANKADNNARIAESYVFYGLGLGEVFPVSSINGAGTGELLDAVVKEFSTHHEEQTFEIPRFSVVGKPNVGKSSFINAILGEERNIVTPIAGTTRDIIMSKYNRFNMEFFLIDTAGLRKKQKVKENVEFYSVMRSVKAIESSDVCFVMLDASEGLASQDLNIFSLAQRNNKGIVLMVNKWDLVKKDQNSVKAWEAEIRKRTAPFVDYPIIFTSVINKQRVYKALESGMDVYNKKTKKIPTSKLNTALLPVFTEMPPPLVKGKRVKIKYITQLPLAYPAFAFFCNLPQYIKEPYKRFVENKLRKLFDFHGVPITIYFRKK